MGHLLMKIQMASHGLPDRHIEKLLDWHLKKSDVPQTKRR
jgi:hypothetical protein